MYKCNKIAVFRNKVQTSLGMKKVIVIIGFFSICFGGFAANSPIAKGAALNVSKLVGEDDIGIKFFHGTWEEAKKTSDTKNKLIFLDAYASWCGPCKIMARESFTDEKVAEYFNAHFINVKMDMEKHAEGPRLSKKFNLTAYPSLYFIDKNEEIVHFALGMHGPKELLKLGQMALSK